MSANIQTLLVSYFWPKSCSMSVNSPLSRNNIRPDQFNLLLLGYCEVKIGPSDRKNKEKKAINWGTVIDHNLIKIA